ncbi:unnamed protein product, partial [Rotaria sp. Silwood1]
NDWDLHLKSIVLAYNTGQHATTKYSPYQLQFGRQPKLPADQPTTTYQFSKPNDYFRHLQKTLQLYHQHATNNIIKGQQSYKQYYDRNRPNLVYHVGDQVLKQLTTQHTKLGELYSDPMIV